MDPQEAKKGAIQVLFNYTRKTRDRDFEVDKENVKVIENLVKYFNEDSTGKYDLRKGIWIMGNFGSGKTLIMQAFSKMKKQFPKANYHIKGCIEMNNQFSQFGYEGLSRFSKCFHNTKQEAICFDDLGEEEPTIQHYGNAICVMAFLLSERYRRWLSLGILTHVTTNKSFQELEEVYGARIASRVVEMFNIILLGGAQDSTDRRK